MSHWKQLLDLPYLSGSEVQGELIVTLKEIKTENFFSPKARKNEDHTVFYFNEIKKGVVFSKRKGKEIEKITGEKDYEKWLGKTMTIFTINEKFFGEFHDVIHFKTATPKVLPTLTEKSDGWKKAKAAINSGATTVAAIRKHYQLSEANRLKLEAK